MQRSKIRQVALGGTLAAVAVVVMCLGGFIPVATYICPMLCTITQFVVLRFCGKRIAWSWYAAVCILTILLCPDKEAALVFLALGYYPLVKQCLERCALSVILKVLYFNLSLAAAYAALIYVLGMQEIVAENKEFGLIGMAVLLAMGNLTFFMLDKFLSILSGKLR